MEAVWLLIGLLVGGGLVFVAYRARHGAVAKEIVELGARLSTAIGERDGHLVRVHELERELVSDRGELRAEIVQLEAALEHERNLAAEKLKAVEQANEELSQSFKALSADALERNSTQFLELAKASFAELHTQARGD